ncbi:uncharacterized protein LOC143460542 [Clavelina lepadiformis]|uniref:G-protein coupled receptors family 1 profile domain-containing protein n=1 Tax=Clavelina lepadiformis TaxID=159417 RepID=A0ABP0FBL5_CLALP
MGNITTPPPFLGDIAWVTCEAIHLICILIALYVLYALLHYRAIKINNKKGSARHRKGGEWLENLCMIGIVAALCRFANNQALLLTWWNSDTRCSTLLNLSIALYFIAMHPVYLFLWVRQRIFYSNRALKHLYGKTVRFLSWAALVCFISVTILCMVLFVVDPENSATGRVCKNASNYQDTNQHFQGVKVNTMAGLLAGGIQLSFLALFLYPIMDNKLRAMRSQHMRSGSIALITLIRRSFVLAGVCILTDVAIALLLKTIYVNFPDAIFAPLAMYDVNLLVNLLCIIMTFRRWRVMFFPWFYSRCCCEREVTVNRQSFIECNPHCNNNRRLCHVMSLESTTQGEKSRNSTAYRGGRNRSRRCTRRGIKEDPVPDVILPMLDGIALPKVNSENFNTESLVTAHDETSGFQQQIHSELQHYSDTVLQTNLNTCQRKRSSSLVIQTNFVPPLKRTKSHLTQSLLTKSKLWLKDGKSSFSSC